MLFEKGKIIKIIAEKDFSDEILQPYILSFGRHQVTNGQHNQTGVLKCQDLWTENLKGLSFSAKKGECITILDMNNRGFKILPPLLMAFANRKTAGLSSVGKRFR